MIKHIVLFQLAEFAEGKTKKENAQFIKIELEKLINVIPQLKKIEVGLNHPEAPQNNYDIALYCEFNSLDDLNIYQEHPAHKEISEYVGKIKTSRVAVDYDV